jgi:glycosyltransferase involved in cell wall biosynthesis
MFLIRLTRTAIELGHDVVILAPSPRLVSRLGKFAGIHISEALSPQNVENKVYPGRIIDANLRKARRIAWTADVIYTKNEPHELLYASMLRSARSALVSGFHSPIERKPGPGGWLRASVYRSPLYRYLTTRVDFFHILQPYQRVFLSQEMRVPAIRTWLIPNGIDVEAFAPGDDLPTGGPFRVLFVGRLEREKGVDTLLAALDLMKVSSLGDLSVTIAGEGALRPYLQSQMVKRANVRVVGYESNIASLYQTHHLLVAPSRRETFPLVPAEALACGLPVLLSKLEANYNIFGDAEAAAMFPSDAPKALAELLEQRMHLWRDDPKAYNRLRKQAREFAVRRLDQSLVLPRLMKRLEKARKHL